MRTEAPPLLPLFRSDGQGRLLARIYLAPERAATIAELGRELGLDAGGLTREANRLERAGLIRSERVGRQRRLLPDVGSPYYPELYSLLLKAFGPATVITRALRDVTGIERAYVFGSWAARYLGTDGEDPRDVDLLVVGLVNRRSLVRPLRELERQLGREVNPTVVSPEQWESEPSGFLRQVKSGPLVELALSETG